MVEDSAMRFGHEELPEVPEPEELVQYGQPSLRLEIVDGSTTSEEKGVLR